VGLPPGSRRRTKGLRRDEVGWIRTPPRSAASALLARLRSAATRHPHDPGFSDLIERLHATSPEVRAWSPRHEIAQIGSGTKRLRHPVLGELTLQHTVLTIADDPEQKLVTFTAADADLSRIRELITPQPCR
jgi:hypothetical protein